MTVFLDFAILGLGTGAIYALLAMGVVVVYQGSGVINFAQGAFGLCGAIAFAELRAGGTGVAVSLIAATAAGAAIGALTQGLIMRPLRDATPLARIIATLGLLIVIESAAALHYGAALVGVAPFLPQHAWVLSGVIIEADRMTLLGIAIVIALALTLINRYSLLGLATRATAEDDFAASTLGWSSNLLATASWTVGGALAGAAGALIVPFTGLIVGVLTLMIVPALAAALLGRFQSYIGALIGAIVIGIAQDLVTQYWSLPGASDALPFLVISVVLVISGRALPIRGHIHEHLPSLGTGRVRLLPAIVAFAVTAILMLTAFSTTWLDAFTVSLSIAVVLLSIVVLTGYAGQISLAQYALAGVGAYVAGRLISADGWPFWLAALAGIAAAVPIGLIFALPALRTRGVNLAVVTLGLGVAVYAVLFSSANWTGGYKGTNVGSPTLFGIDVDGINHPDRWCVVCLCAFFGSALAVAWLRRGRIGRQLIAIRENERAAASLGVSVVRTKFLAFAIGSALAALGGILISFRFSSIDFTAFDPFQSIYAVAFTVIGGVGYVLGPLLGSLLTSGGIGSLLNPLFGGIGNYLVLIGGVIVIVTLIANPDGMAPGTLRSLRWLARRSRLPARRQRTGVAELAVKPTDAEPVRAQELEISGLTVRFGASHAVDDVSLRVEPGEIVGLIGPNGAGKTTLIDAVTGFVPRAAGTIRLGEQDLGGRGAHARVRAGVARSWQSLELFEHITVLENLQIAADLDSRVPSSGLLARARGREHKLSAAASLAVSDFELAGDLARMPNELPYGRRRLVAIARAVTLRPSVLLLDEPAAGLDEHESAELGHLLRRLAESWGLGILLVEHDLHLVMSTCDRIVVLDAGKKIAEGSSEEVRRDPAVIGAYIGTRKTTQLEPSS